MESINKMEKKIISKPKLPKFIKPWTTSIPSLKNTTVMEKLLPTSNEGVYEIYIAWRGPKYVTEYRKFLACTVLLKYIARDSGYEKYSESALYLHVAVVDPNKIDSVYPMFQARFKSIANGE